MRKRGKESLKRKRQNLQKKKVDGVKENLKRDNLEKEGDKLLKQKGGKREGKRTRWERESERIWRDRTRTWGGTENLKKKIT